jgi:hypothetical protein
MMSRIDLQGVKLKKKVAGRAGSFMLQKQVNEIATKA